MKRAFLHFCSLATLFLTGLPKFTRFARADAAVDPDALPNASTPINACGEWTFCNPLSKVTSLQGGGVVIVQVILGLIGTITLLMLIIAGVTYVTSAGNEEKVKKAKKIITGSVIGLAIALLAFSLLNTVIAILEA